MREITIYGKFPSLNKYVDACRRNHFAGNKMIHDAEKKIIKALEGQKPLKTPIQINYLFCEENRRRDHDNVSSFFHKVFQDSLTKAGLIPNDGWNEISGYKDDFTVDKDNPRIEVMIFEGRKHGRKKDVRKDDN